MVNFSQAKNKARKNSHKRKENDTKKQQELEPNRGIEPSKERSEKLTILMEKLPLRNRSKTGFFYPIRKQSKEKIECSFPCDGKDMCTDQKIIRLVRFL